MNSEHFIFFIFFFGVWKSSSCSNNARWKCAWKRLPISVSRHKRAVVSIYKYLIRKQHLETKTHVYITYFVWLDVLLHLGNTFIFYKLANVDYKKYCKILFFFILDSVHWVLLPANTRHARTTVWYMQYWISWELSLLMIEN